MERKRDSDAQMLLTGSYLAVPYNKTTINSSGTEFGGTRSILSINRYLTIRRTRNITIMIVN